MRFNFKKIASVLSSAVMVSSTVALAAAATYPAPFVKSGAADVGVVFGSAAGAQLDLAAVVDLTSDLQYRLAAQTASSGSSSSGSTATGTDFVKLAKASDFINLGNSVATVFGATVTDDASEGLPVLLADGTYQNDENSEFEYEQKLTLGSLTLSHFADTDYKDKAPTVGFKLTSGTPIINYTLDFITKPESDVATGDLADFETTELKILGKDYYILDADNGTSGTYLGTFTFLDAANAAILSEGETQTVTVGDKSYEVAISYVGESSARIDVNGQVTNSLAVGGTYKLSDGTYVGLKDILYSSKDTGVSKVEISLGSGKLEIASNDEIELNDEDIDGLKGYIYRGTSASSKEKIDKIVFEWIVDEENFIADGEGKLTFPGFEAVEFTAASFYTPYKELVEVEPDNEDTISLSAPIKDGDADLPLMWVNASGAIEGLGKDADERFTSSSTTTLYYNETKGDEYFVVSWNSSSDSESYLVTATVGEVNDRNTLTIKNKITNTDTNCKDKNEGATCSIGSATLTITNVTKTGTHKFAEITGGSGVTFNQMFTKQGLTIRLPFETTTSGTMTVPGAINLSTSSATAGHSGASYLLFFVEENKNDVLGSGTLFNLTIDSTTDFDIQVNDIDTSELEYEIGDTDVMQSYVESDLATRMTFDTGGDQDSATIEYHGGESFMDVYLAAPDVTVTSEGGSSSGGSVTQLGNIAVSDSEVSSVSSKNLIVVGGSCVNSFAAQLLGVSYPTCGSNWQTKTNVGAGSFLVQTFARSGDKVATLVAGYNAGDTANAVKKLTTDPAKFDLTAGKAYTGDLTSVTMVTTTP